VASADYVPRARWGKVLVRAACARCATPVAGGRWDPPESKREDHALRPPLWQLDEGYEMMSAFQEHQEELEHYEQMFGRERGRLAVSLDRLTNALVLVGQHGVYCTSQRNPAVPAMDLADD